MPALPPLAEALLALLRWLHALATVAFLGWTAVYLLEQPAAEQRSARARRHKEVTEVTLFTFLATGAVLAFDRLSRGAGGLYAALLFVKVLLAVGSYQFAFRWRRVGMPPFGPDGRLVLAFGAAAVLASSILKGVSDSGLRGSQ